MTDCLLCLHFCATYYQNFGNWALAYSRDAMFSNFLRWFRIDRSNGFYDISIGFLSSKMQRSTNHKAKPGKFGIADSARIQESKKVTLVKISQSHPKL